ncbi:MAG: zinc-binding alcohol dehydrogenase [Candidatus Pelagibacter sp.]|nr:zinc-binding alcohol dehydrogenase [Candidatus Pelagibacter sp.]|tara:strand:- start:1256 stop:2257 length:1002 start_codon:yes stop_codon:yes gene_type:complete
MPDTFKAIVIDNKNENFSRNIKELEKNFLGEGNILVKIDYSDLNFKDAMILKNGGKLVKEYPRIPGIDFSGTVSESNDDEFKEGDKVILTGCRVGELFHGGYSEFARVKKDFLIKCPNKISTKEAMILGTAGLTALLCAFSVKAKEELLLQSKVNDVLVTGSTGGVGMVAVMILSKMGINVTAITGKPEKEAFLRELGAKNVINRKEFEGEPKLLDKGTWDGVVDTVGGNILSNAISQTKPKGIVALCGNASSNKLNTNVLPFILRAVKLWGVDSVNISKKRKEFVWSEFPGLLDFNILGKAIKEVSLNELLEIFPKMLDGKLSNKILVNVNK